MMKLQFDPNLPYQEQAIASVVDLFRGQTPKQANFTVSIYANQLSGQTGMAFTEHGIGNRLELDEEDILANLQDVQLRNGIAQTKKLSTGKYVFDTEMETGTGKTYVYLRTLFELNRAYGFTKFIIVVPSIAIKEGVYKSLQITEEHFRALYDNVVYDYLVYDGAKPDMVRDFAVNDCITIMLINIDSFRRSFIDPEKENKANTIHRQNDKLNGMRPIELIQETNPIVIIDEPQSVDTTPKSKEAIASLHPLCTLRYTATPRDINNLIYKLDAVDAFDMGLVKQIEVASFASQDYHNRAYLKLISVDNRKSPITATIEMDCLKKDKVERSSQKVKADTDLYELSGGRDVYEGYIVGEIYCEPGNEYVSFTSKPDILRIGEAEGDIDDRAIKEQQIHKTIEEHLNKELVLNPKGIKVLSLFFIDRVSNYRYYDDAGNAHKGVYALLFEKHYRELIRLPKYRTLFQDIDTETAAEDVHDGYFAIDKKVKKADGTEENIFKDSKGDEGKTQADEDGYNLIMRDKERLLSFDTKLRFIFSHSALREGWDNPNVFQICTLNETNSNMKKRQEIGRGLRLCVDQNGTRQYGFAINTLTVMANESYDEYARNLQKEYEKDEGIVFGILEKHSFANIPVKQPDGGYQYLGIKPSEAVFQMFEAKGYINEKGKVQDKLKAALKYNLLELPPEVEASRPAIMALCKKVSGNLNIRSTDDRRKVQLNKSVYLDPDFEALWDRIKWKTTYNVEFSSEKLISQCCEKMKNSLMITSAKLIYTRAKMNITTSGVDAQETARASVLAANTHEPLPDIVTYLQNRTNLTRKTLVAILIRSGTLELFGMNPQRYMEESAGIIASVMRQMLVDGIRYTRLGDQEYYAQELFDTKELTGYLEHNMISSQKSVYEYVVYDSQNEENFARQFEANEAVKLYAKLPGWFTIPTPLGTYNPDWAVLINKDGEQKLYFVIETKMSLLADDLRAKENLKIQCGTAHFRDLRTGIAFEKADDFNRFMDEHCC